MYQGVPLEMPAVIRHCPRRDLLRQAHLTPLTKEQAIFLLGRWLPRWRGPQDSLRVRWIEEGRPRIRQTPEGRVLNLPGETLSRDNAQDRDPKLSLGWLVHMWVHVRGQEQHDAAFGRRLGEHLQQLSADKWWWRWSAEQRLAPLAYLTPEWPLPGTRIDVTQRQPRERVVGYKVTTCRVCGERAIWTKIEGIEYYTHELLVQEQRQLARVRYCTVGGSYAG